MQTSFQRVAEMNTAFGNPKGNYNNFDVVDLLNQVSNIFDEYIELLTSFGVEIDFDCFKAEHIQIVQTIKDNVFGPDLNLLDARDALCDIQVFVQGAQHKMGVNGDDDMRSVVEGVMTRFVKSDDDLEASLKKHKVKLGVDVELEGTYPTAILRSIKDGPDRPKGKFLKSASYTEPVFTNPVLGDLLSNVNPMDEHSRWEWLTKGELVDNSVLAWNGDKPAVTSFVIKHANGKHAAYQVAI